MTTTRPNSLYEQDFYLWLEQTLHLLKSGELEKLDIEHLIEEIEGMSSSQRQALRSNLEIVLLHLIKYKYQPEKRSHSWLCSLLEHRLRLDDMLEESPSLGNYLQEVIDKCYRRARKRAIQEAHLNPTEFPTECPFTVEQILDENFLPE